MNDESHTAHNQSHHSGQWVELKGKVDVETSGIDPGEEVFDQRITFMGGLKKPHKRDGCDDKRPENSKAKQAWKDTYFFGSFCPNTARIKVLSAGRKGISQKISVILSFHQLDVFSFNGLFLPENK